MQSMDYNTKNAAEKISEMEDPALIASFISGDERKTVIDAADKRISDLRGPKEGEQTTPMTEKGGGFKGGISGAKSAEELPPRDYVTCEDVLSSIRGKGGRI